MKRTWPVLIITTAMVVSGCLSQTLKEQKTLSDQQISALNIDCETRDIRITDQSTELNGTENWTAECGGKTYHCTYLNESSADCYEVSD